MLSVDTVGFIDNHVTYSGGDVTFFTLDTCYVVPDTCLSVTSSDAKIFQKKITLLPLIRTLNTLSQILLPSSEISLGKSLEMMYYTCKHRIHKFQGLQLIICCHLSSFVRAICLPYTQRSRSPASCLWPEATAKSEPYHTIREQMLHPSWLTFSPALA